MKIINHIINYMNSKEALLIDFILKCKNKTKSSYKPKYEIKLLMRFVKEHNLYKLINLSCLNTKDYFILRALETNNNKEINKEFHRAPYYLQYLLDRRLEFGYRQALILNWKLICYFDPYIETYDNDIEDIECTYSIINNKIFHNSHEIPILIKKLKNGEIDLKLYEKFLKCKK